MDTTLLEGVREPEVKPAQRERYSQLLPQVYDRLRRLAARRMQPERAGHTLQPTAVVHEAYLRLLRQKNLDINNEAELYTIMSNIMHRILVDHARRANAARRGGGRRKFQLDDNEVVVMPRDQDLCALDEALSRLAEIDARRASLVKLRVFGGLTITEIARLLDRSERMVYHDWRFATAWLGRQMRQGENCEP